MSGIVFSHDFKTREKNNSIATAIVLCANALSPLLSLIPNGIVIIIFIPLAYLIINNCDYYFGSGFNARSFMCFLLYFFIFFGYSFCVSSIRSSVIECFKNFLVFGIPLTLISFLKVRSIYILRTIVMVGIIAIPMQLLQIDFSNTSDAGVWMMVSYNLLKIIVPSVIVVFYDKSIIFKFIGLCEVFIGIAFLVVLGSRGAVLGLLLSLLLLFLYRQNKKIQICSFKALSVVIIIVIIAIFFEPIVRFIYEWLQNHNISSYSLMRMVNNLSEGTSLSSGRNEIYAVAISSIKENLIIGTGIGSFDNYSGAYPHNIFLQILYEGGGVFGIPLILLIILSISSVNQEVSLEIRLLYVFLISAGFVQLLFSSNFWSSILFWYWIGLSLKRIQL